MVPQKQRRKRTDGRKISLKRDMRVKMRKEIRNIIGSLLPNPGILLKEIRGVFYVVITERKTV